jgi:hypothetical protein
MLRYLLLPTLFLSLIKPTKKICDCLNYEGSFLKAAPSKDLVVLLKVNKYLSYKTINDTKMPLSMEAEIMDIYKGQQMSKQIIIWGDNGALCRPYLSTFDKGGFYLMALDSIQYADGKLLKEKNNYEISICGAYWLTVDHEKSTATGDIDRGDMTDATWCVDVLKNAFLNKCNSQ